VINELSIDPKSFPDEELDELLAKASNTSTSTTALQTASGQGSPSSRHHISRVVVLHNDKLETYFNQEPDDILASLISVPNMELASCVVGSPLPSFPSDDFFDSDSFWTGSLTWY
jgi:DNA-binding transcriptional MocR family regulator